MRCFFHFRSPVNRARSMDARAMASPRAPALDLQSVRQRGPRLALLPQDPVPGEQVPGPCPEARQPPPQGDQAQVTQPLALPRLLAELPELQGLQGLGLRSQSRIGQSSG
ncbi:hypothetical protein CEXT_799481 [Caerostris extrusa]|uniref:Uncharacterized protein n=1 Tax=Caerostris extrusa TaxID=172846 RepID=A0AAV4WUF1_CAEEX|nr:hypothetical protein CEXT_799481 [Caerostris extrusa]